MGWRYKTAWRINGIVRKKNKTIGTIQTLRHCECNEQFGGFYELYSIDATRKNHNADSDRENQQGLNSPYGRRGAICQHFGWTYDYLLHGIAWSVVQRMMIDAPSYDLDNGVEEIKLTENNGEQILNYVNSMM